jgi:tRNA A-37 threonylcarbamoyl transferase component Bud32
MTLIDRLRRLVGRPRLVIPDDLDPPPPRPPEAGGAAGAEAWLQRLVARLAAGEAGAADALGSELDPRIDALAGGGHGRLAAEWLDKLAVAAPPGPERDAVRLRAAEIYAARGEDAAALPHLEALAAGAGDAAAARAHFLLGEYHARQGDRRRALASFEAVLARDVTYPNARARAFALRAALGAAAPPRPAAAGATLAGVEGQAVTAARYRLLAEIGRGATGAVYRARDSELERDVAVKLLHPHLGGHGTLARFFAEARVAASLRHPNIVAILDLDEEHRRIVMELLAGGTLRERLRDGRLSLPEALERHAEILAALAAAHRRGVIHRDLKPGNLLFRRAASPTEIVLGDFGTAHLGAPVQVDVLVGTLRYMAPEQRRGAAGPPGDVYAAGVILHEMLGGPPPASLAAAAPESGLELLAPGPPGLAEHLRALTRADPALRPSTDEALAQARALAGVV